HCSYFMKMNLIFRNAVGLRLRLRQNFKNTQSQLPRSRRQLCLLQNFPDLSHSAVFVGMAVLMAVPVMMSLAAVVMMVMMAMNMLMSMFMAVQIFHVMIMVFMFQQYIEVAHIKAGFLHPADMDFISADREALKSFPQYGL